MSQKVEAQGGKLGQQWDDGADHDGITKIQIGKGRKGIQYIKFDYVKSGKPIPGSVHGQENASASVYTFEINHPDELLVSVEGYYDDYGVIQGLQFKTNERTFELVGYTDVSKFSIGDRNKMIVGFHGYAGKDLSGLGAYISKRPVFRKVEARGGKSGQKWSDGGDHDGVTKIYVGGGPEGVRYVKFDYVKNAQPVDAPVHGEKNKTFTQTFEINNPEEYLKSVEGYYNASGVIRALEFKTNKKTSGIIGYDEGTKFTLGVKSNRIVGFHGSSDKYLTSLGVYVIPSPPTRVGAVGGSGGNAWDHSGYNGVKRVYFGTHSKNSTPLVCYIKFVFDKDGKEEAFEHGTRQDTPQEFVLDYPNEYITRVEGTYGHAFPYVNDGIVSISFTSSKGRTSATVGTNTGNKFVFEDDGNQVVGFFGRSGAAVDALGAYFAAAPPSESKKLEGRGGNGGTSWDDDAYDGVRKVYVGQGDLGVAFVKFEYMKDSNLVDGAEHGKRTKLGAEEFEIDYPNEYITSVEGYYDKIYGSEAEVITMLRFKTNKRTSQPFGLEGGTKFVIEEKDCKIVGFHGKAGDILHQIGVHVVPI